MEGLDDDNFEMDLLDSLMWNNNAHKNLSQ